MIGICRNDTCRNRTCFPVVWRLLGKAGNSNTGERIALMRRFLALVDAEDVRAFVADREFIGEKWLGYLKSEEVPFFIRIRKNTNVGASKTAAHKLFSSLEIGQKRVVPGGKKKVLGQQLHVVGLIYVGPEICWARRGAGAPAFGLPQASATGERPRRALCHYRMSLPKEVGNRNAFCRAQVPWV